MPNSLLWQLAWPPQGLTHPCPAICPGVTPAQTFREAALCGKIHPRSEPVWDDLPSCCDFVTLHARPLMSQLLGIFGLYLGYGRMQHGMALRHCVAMQGHFACPCLQDAHLWCRHATLAAWCSCFKAIPYL